MSFPLNMVHGVCSLTKALLWLNLKPTGPEKTTALLSPCPGGCSARNVWEQQRSVSQRAKFTIAKIAFQTGYKKTASIPCSTRYFFPFVATWSLSRMLSEMVLVSFSVWCSDYSCASRMQLPKTSQDKSLYLIVICPEIVDLGRSLTSRLAGYSCKVSSHDAPSQLTHPVQS